MLKRIVAVFVVATMCVVNGVTSYSLAGITGSSTESVKPYFEYPSDVRIVISSMNFGDLTKEEFLYSSDDTITATYLEFENGYLIYDKNGVVVEYSDESFPCFSGSEDKVYYIGPFQYYLKNENEFVNFGNEEEISYEEFESSSINFEEISDSLSITNDVANNNEYSVYSSSTPKIYTKQLTAPKRSIYGNTDGTCGSLALTMLILYYSDVRNTNLVMDFFLNYPKAMYEQLKRYVEYDGDLCPLRHSTIHGSDYQTRKFGLIAFMDSYGTSNGKKHVLEMDKNMSLHIMARMVIGGGGVPGIVAWDTNENGYLDHEVFTYGYREITLDSKLIRSDFIVNDGWSQSRVFINMEYCGYFQYFG